MGYYEPQWSVEEQTMIDLMALTGHYINADINKEYTDIYLYDGTTEGYRFRECTEYGAIRKCFAYWEKNHAVIC